MISEYDYRIVSDTDEIIYGIAVFDGDSIVGAVPSVCSDKTTVTELVKLCNELQLDPVHLCDVVSDEFSICL